MRRAARASSRERGFTLLELIVAAGILALIAVFSWRGLDALVREREAIAASQGTIDQLQRSFARIERDALQARDAQLDEDGTLKLVAGPSSVDGAPAATVAYRLIDGALTRAVVGLDAAPQMLVGGVGALTVEAWTPGPRGGGWVRVKAAATEAPRPQAPAQATTPPPAGAPDSGTPADPLAPAPVSSTASGGAPNTVQPPGPTVAAATGIRLSIARADGTKISRDFLVGGG